MGGALNTYGEDERCIQGFGEETWDHLQDPDVDGRIILNGSSGSGMGGRGLDWSGSG